MTTHRRTPDPRIGLHTAAGLVLIGAAAALPLSGVSAHHAAGAIFHTDQIIEIEGEITGLVWRNPHVRMTVDVPGAPSGTVEWEIETIPVARLTRVGVGREVFAVGQTVSLAGYPSRRSDAELYAINMLLPDGREVLLDTPEPRWSNSTLGTGSDFTPGTRGADPGLGLFRVWSTDGSRLTGEVPFELAAQAQAALAAWDPLSPDNPFIGCTAKGMPTIMGQPNPMEIVDDGGRILIRLEEYDTERVIDLTPRAPDDDRPPVRLGHSFGRWEGATLVVETDRIDWEYFNQGGLMQSEAMSLVERFTPSADGARLDYEVTVTDPALFVQPTVLSRSWIWVPGDAVQPYDCLEQ